jgi:hypothetical protein
MKRGIGSLSRDLPHLLTGKLITIYGFANRAKLPKKRRAGAETAEILAHRMALYLRAIGIEPVAPAGANQRETQAAYDQQWAALPLYWRSRARRLARTRVMAVGLAHPWRPHHPRQL